MLDERPQTIALEVVMAIYLPPDELHLAMKSFRNPVAYTEVPHTADELESLPYRSL